MNKMKLFALMVIASLGIACGDGSPVAPASSTPEAVSPAPSINNPSNIIWGVDLG